MYFTKTLPAFVVALSVAAAQTASNGTGPVTGLLGNASVVENNPPGVVYTATLPDKEFFNPNDPRGNIKGSVVAVANPNGIGVSFQINFQNLPTSGGPFLYHLHAFPVPSDGNCTKTLAHLDPYQRGEDPVCNSSLPQTCQVGDLSGKYGKITQDPFVASFSDDFASTAEGIGAYFGNRSFAVHFGNKTRITCANFTLTAGSVVGNTTAKPSPTSTGGPIQFSGLATSGKSIGSGLSLMAAGVFFFL